VTRTEAKKQYIAHIQGLIHEALGPCVTSEPFALLDFPDIKNVGDSAIWVGEIAYFRDRFGRAPDYVSAIENLDPAALERAVPKGPIFLHGGGNLGDIWLGHQVFREQVLERWPDRPVVQLPQSIHFNSQERAKQAAEVIARHKNFTLLVRDQESLAFAKEHFDCTVRLCPDMAFCIGEIAPDGAVEFPLLAMRRKDKEQVASSEDSAGGDIPVEDWISEDPKPVKAARTKGLLESALSFNRARMRVTSYNAVAEQRVGRGVKQLSRADTIITDRLHVHIISTLMGKPHAVLDNSYGKIARFRAAFPEPEGLTYAASSYADALAWARQQA
jgi:exopolysaccharide biosynthesis predicted pyruvyltransferase EpsI